MTDPAAVMRVKMEKAKLFAVWRRRQGSEVVDKEVTSLKDNEAEQQQGKAEAKWEHPSLNSQTCLQNHALEFIALSWWIDEWENTKLGITQSITKWTLREMVFHLELIEWA